MYAIGLRHSRDANGAAHIHGFARSHTGAAGRTGRGRPDIIGDRTCARAGSDVTVPGSRVGPGSGP